VHERKLTIPITGDVAFASRTSRHLRVWMQTGNHCRNEASFFLESTHTPK